MFETPARRTGESRRATAAARLIALATVLQFMTAHRLWQLPFPNWMPETYALFGLVAVLVLSGGDARGLGLCLQPARGWWHWCRIGLWLGAAIGFALLAWMGFVYAAGITLPVPRIEPPQRWPTFVYMCIYAPLLEELLFRSLLIFAVRPTLGDRGAIVTSGVLFAAMHVIGGNASPENQIAGFVFAWAFVQSGTVVVPLSWHAIGNMIAFGAQVANWHFAPAEWP